MMRLCKFLKALAVLHEKVSTHFLVFVEKSIANNANTLIMRT